VGTSLADCLGNPQKDLAGDTALIIRRLIVPLTVAAAVACAGHARAQGAFPAPLPGQAVQPNDPAFPPVNGSAPMTMGPAAGAPAPFPGGGPGGFAPAPPTQQGAMEACMKQFLPLREEAEKRGKLIKAASDRKAGPEEACKLIGNYSAAEAKMIEYVKSHAAKCGIPAQIGEQLQGNHKGTEALQKKVCAVAQQVQQRGPAGPSLSEVLGSSSAPEATTGKKGGSTFDTLNGNVLTR
jgi:hypothetical protein